MKLKKHTDPRDYSVDVQCSVCLRMRPLEWCLADLDDKPGTFYCSGACLSTKIENGREVYDEARS